MKKILLGLLIVAALSACSSSEEKEVNIPTQVKMLNEAVVVNANTLTEIKSGNEEVRTQLEAGALKAGAMMAEGHMKLEKAFEETGATVTKVDDGLYITFPENLGFITGKAVLNEETKAILDPIAEALIVHFDELPHSGTDVMITGHTDSTGSVEFNQKLSEDRAMAVSDYLVDKGIDSSRIETVGVESSEPRDGKMANRRVDLKIIY